MDVFHYFTEEISHRHYIVIVLAMQVWHITSECVV